MIYIFPTDTCYGIACPLEDKRNYEKMYKIKKRNLGKPLAIMVENFAWLRENTDLTDEQVDFLERYEHPFTVLTNSNTVELFLQFSDESEDAFLNKDVYEEVAFRVASNDIESKLIRGVGPIWLTSANISGAGETYSVKKVEDDFAYYLEKEIVEIVGSYELDPEVGSSDVFGFIDDTLEIEYVRQN